MKPAVQIHTLQTLLQLRQQGHHQAMLGHVARIPVKNYIDATIFEKELSTVFRDHPVVAGHASHVRDPGSYLLSDWHRIPFVVVRDQNQTLRAFLNTCRHRGARLVSGKEEKLNSLVCPFHGWVYGLDGQLRAISRPDQFPGIDCQHMGLVELPVAEQGGLIWIHPRVGACIDLQQSLGPFAEDFDHFGIAQLSSFRKTKVTRRANWKLLIKTYLEGYHVPYLHKTTLSRAFKNGVIAHQAHGNHIRLAAARSNVLDAQQQPSEDWRILDYASVYYALFPHAFFIMHPDYVSLNCFYPLAIDQTLWTHELLYHPAAFPGNQGQLDLAQRFEYTNDLVFDAEDFAVAEVVQSSLVHGANEFHTLGLEEGLLAVFQQNIDRAMDAPPT